MNRDDLLYETTGELVASAGAILFVPAGCANLIVEGPNVPSKLGLKPGAQLGDLALKASFIMLALNRDRHSQERAVALDNAYAEILWQEEVVALRVINDPRYRRRELVET